MILGLARVKTLTTFYYKNTFKHLYHTLPWQCNTGVLEFHFRACGKALCSGSHELRARRPPNCFCRVKAVYIDSAPPWEKPPVNTTF
jgi:hypothetical protein